MLPVFFSIFEKTQNMQKILFLLLFITSLSNQITAHENLDTITIPHQDTLIIGCADGAPFVIIDEKEIEGVSVWLWKKIAKDLGLEYRLVRMGFGDMLHALENGDIDVSINPLTITHDRSKTMAFTQPFYAANSSIVVAHLSYFQKLHQFLGSFFSLNFLSGFLFLIAVICMFGAITWYFERKQNPEHFRSGWNGVWDGLWWSVVTMTTVGYGDKSPKSRGGKLVALIWMFSGLLFISGFTASVASSLTINQLNWNPYDLSDFKDRTIGSIEYSSTAGYLKNHFFRKLEVYPNLPDALDALERHEIAAFLYDEPILKHRMLTDERYHDLELLPIQFDSQFYAFGLPKEKEELRILLSQKILEYTEKSMWEVVLAEYGIGSF